MFHREDILSGKTASRIQNKKSSRSTFLTVTQKPKSTPRLSLTPSSYRKTETQPHEKKQQNCLFAKDYWKCEGICKMEEFGEEKQIIFNPEINGDTSVDCPQTPISKLQVLFMTDTRRSSKLKLYSVGSK